MARRTQHEAFQRCAESRHSVARSGVYTPEGGGAPVNVSAVFRRGVEVVGGFSEVVGAVDTIELLTSQINAKAGTTVTIDSTIYQLEVLLDNDGIETTWRVKQL